MNKNFVILAGGKQTRFGVDRKILPKHMVKVRGDNLMFLNIDTILSKVDDIDTIYIIISHEDDITELRVKERYPENSNIVISHDDKETKNMSWIDRIDVKDDHKYLILCGDTLYSKSMFDFLPEENNYLLHIKHHEGLENWIFDGKSLVRYEEIESYEGFVEEIEKLNNPSIYAYSCFLGKSLTGSKKRDLYDIIDEVDLDYISCDKTKIININRQDHIDFAELMDY